MTQPELGQIPSLDKYSTGALQLTESLHPKSQLTKQGRNISLMALTELAHKRVEFRADADRVQKSGCDVVPRPNDVPPGRYRPVATPEYHLPINEADWIDNALSLNAERIVDSVDPEVLNGVLHPDYHFLPSFLRPLLRIPGVQQIVDRLDSIAIKKLLKEEISRPASKGYERGTDDIREGGALAARLLIDQEARNNSRASGW